MKDSLHTLLVDRKSMDSEMLNTLHRRLSETLEDWLVEQIEDDTWPAQSWPFFGDLTAGFMATAALSVLNAIYDAELALIREKILDPDMAGLPHNNR